MKRAHQRTAADLLRVAAICDDGLLIRCDGACVRCLEVGAVNPLVLDAAEVQRISAAFAQVTARLPDRRALQLYAQARALSLDEVLAAERHGCELVAGAAEDGAEHERAQALRGLCSAAEESITAQAQSVAALSLRHLVICPWPVPAGEEERGARESLRHALGIAADLEALGLPARLLEAGELLDLLHERFDPDATNSGEPPVSFMAPGAIGAPIHDEAPALADERQAALAQAICTAPIDLSDRRHLRMGQTLERVLYLSLAPEQTWLGWLLHLMQSPAPFTLSVHVEACERYRERLAQKRRYRRIFGVNRGVEQRGRPLDFDAAAHEQEAADLLAELATSAGAGIYRVSVYLAIQQPFPADAEVLAELCESAARELSIATDARVQHGPYAQCELWRSTLPLGLDVAKRRRRYVSANVGDSFPLLGTSCGSPSGIPLGVAAPGRTLERLDPFDPVHPNHLLLVNGMAGAGKTMASILLLARAIAQGATGAIIDRAGHFDFLASLLPGSASVAIGAGAHAVCPWDTENPARVAPEKVDYLLALHALLLGQHHAARDSYGLSDLEANLLGLAIGRVYERCAASKERPRELLLQKELQRRYEEERAQGSIAIAEALRDLALRLHNYVGAGPYAYLADAPTTAPQDAPLVVFDTRAIPQAKAPAAMFAICEHVKARIERTRATFLAGDGPAHAWAGRSFLVIDEAWSLIERPATGRWFNEFVRRSRHFALWLIAISQQLSDFDCEHGRALLANAAMRLFLRQEARELRFAQAALALSDEALQAIAQLQTVRGRYASAYLMNGARGQGTVQIGVGPSEYWIASSDPARDEPLRARAMRESGGDAWVALSLLTDERWHEELAHEEEGVNA